MCILLYSHPIRKTFPRWECFLSSIDRTLMIFPDDKKAR